MSAWRARDVRDAFQLREVSAVLRGYCSRLALDLTPFGEVGNAASRRRRPARSDAAHERLHVVDADQAVGSVTSHGGHRRTDRARGGAPTANAGGAGPALLYSSARRVRGDAARRTRAALIATPRRDLRLFLPNRPAAPRVSDSPRNVAIVVPPGLAARFGLEDSLPGDPGHSPSAGSAGAALASPGSRLASLRGRAEGLAYDLASCFARRQRRLGDGFAVFLERSPSNSARPARTGRAPPDDFESVISARSTAPRWWLYRSRARTGMAFAMVHPLTSTSDDVAGGDVSPRSGRVNQWHV